MQSWFSNDTSDFGHEEDDCCCDSDVPEESFWISSKCLVPSSLESLLLRNSTLDSDEERSEDGDVVWLTGRGRRTGFGGSLLSSVGFFTGLILLSDTVTFVLAVMSDRGLAYERIWDSVLGCFNALRCR